MDVCHPVGHVLPADVGTKRLEFGLHAVQRQRVYVLAVYKPGNKRRGNKRSWDRVVRLLGAHDNTFRLAALGVVGTAGGAAIHMAAVLLDDKVCRHDANLSCHLNRHLGKLIATFRACAPFRFDLMVDDDSLKLAVVDGGFAAAAADALLGQDVF